MFLVNTRQLKVKDLKADKYKWRFKNCDGHNDMCEFEVNEDGDLIITVSDTPTAWLWNDMEANQNIFAAIERLGVSENAKIFAKYNPEDYDDKLYKVIDFWVDKEQTDPYERAYAALITVARA